jgi:hypothetical protein
LQTGNNTGLRHPESKVLEAEAAGDMVFPSSILSIQEKKIPVDPKIPGVLTCPALSQCFKMAAKMHDYRIYIMKNTLLQTAGKVLF